MIKSLLDAIVQGNLDTVKSIIEKDPSILETTFENGDHYQAGKINEDIQFHSWHYEKLPLTVVHFAFAVHQAEIAQYLIQKQLKSKADDLVTKAGGGAEITPLRLLVDLLFTSSKPYNSPTKITLYNSSFFYLLLQGSRLDYYYNHQYQRKNLGLANEIGNAIPFEKPKEILFGWMYVALSLRKESLKLNDEEKRLYAELEKVHLLPKREDILQELQQYKDTAGFAITLTAINKVLSTLHEKNNLNTKSNTEFTPLSKEDFRNLFGKEPEIPFNEKAQKLQINLFYHLNEFPLVWPDTASQDVQKIQDLLLQDNHKKFATMAPLSTLLDSANSDEALKKLRINPKGLQGAIAVLQEIKKLDGLSKIHQLNCTYLIDAATQLLDSSEFQIQIAINDINKKIASLNTIHSLVTNHLLQNNPANNNDPSPLLTLAEKLHKTQRDMEETQAKLTTLDTQIQGAFASMQPVLQLQEAMKKLAEDIKTVEQQLADIKIQQAQDLEHVTLEIKKRTNEVQNLQKNIQGLQEQEEQLKSQLVEQKNKLTDLGNSQTKLSIEIEKFEAKRQTIEEDLKTLENSQGPQLHKEIVALAESYKQLEQQNKQLEARNTQLENQVSQLVSAAASKKMTSTNYTQINYNTHFFNESSQNSFIKQKEYINSRFFLKNNPLTKTKDNILNHFYLFSKDHMELHPKEMIEQWVTEYKNTFNQDPIAELKKNRSTLVSRAITSSINLLLNYVEDFNKQNNLNEYPEQLNEFLNFRK